MTKKTAKKKTTKKPVKTKAVAKYKQPSRAVMKKAITAYVKRLEKVVEEHETKELDPRLELIFIGILQARAKKDMRGQQPLDAKTLEREYTILVKLVSAWSIGATDGEACTEAHISTSALSRYLQTNPELALYRDELRENPIMTARRTVVENLQKDYGLAFRFLQAKRPKEFSLGRFAGGGSGGGSEVDDEHRKEVDRVFDLIREKHATK